jgi:hypothetical protein
VRHFLVAVVSNGEKEESRLYAASSASECAMS